jgi:hypothetical protein
MYLIKRAGLTIMLAALAWMALPALAQSPHFVGKVTSQLLSDGAAQVCFKEAGLGDNLSITYAASADATATYVCENGGGQCPNAANKQTVNGPVSATGTFNSGKNGSISQCLTLEPPSAGSFTCPGGQTLTLSDVAYKNIEIKDTTNNVQQSASPSTLSAIIFTCP